jgi:hypothetical protein
MAKSSPINCASLKATVKKCQSDIKSDQHRIVGIEDALRHTQDPSQIVKLEEELHARQSDIRQAELLEEETRIEINEHC